MEKIEREPVKTSHIEILPKTWGNNTIHSHIKYWIWLTTRVGIAPKEQAEIINHFQLSPERLFLSTEEEIEELDLTEMQKSRLNDKNLDGVYKIIEDCSRLGIEMICYQDSYYPNLLRSLNDAPLLLYYKGKFPDLEDKLTICAVGAREATQYGLINSAEIAMELTQAGVYLVTGMAEGIDSATIRGALKANGPVISVVAGGLNVVYPKINEELYEDVATVGVLISEYPPSTPHRAAHFPKRNRILSGLSEGVFVVECRENSGTMITAQLAEQQGRTLFALPGSVQNPMSKGPHLLIREYGAEMMTCASDFLRKYYEEYPYLSLNEMDSYVVKQRLSSVTEVLQQQATRKPKVAKKPKVSKKKEKPEVFSDTSIVAQVLPAAKGSVDASRGSYQEITQGRKERKLLFRKDLPKRFTDDQIRAIETLQTKPYTIESLVETTQIPTKRMISALIMLQVDAVVEELENHLFVSLVELQD